jgi:RNA polymerase sigma factor (sigma-70 family)
MTTTIGPTSRGKPEVPRDMQEASTHSSLMRPHAEAARWLYYQTPVRNYLVGLKCPEQDLDDLTHEVLIKLQTHIVTRYDASRPFRPYFKAAIRNLYFNHLRNRTKAADAAREADERRSHPHDDSLMDALRDYAKQVYEMFSADAPEKLKPSVQMLHAWFIDGLKQEEVAKRWGMTGRQVRTHLDRAADHLANWMQRRINAEDLQALADAAESAADELPPCSLRDLFSHVSQRKRKRVLLILSTIYRKRR